MPIALFSDLVSMLTVHIYSFYIASARIFNWQLTIIISLFHLFRGKKRNVLRNRIDSCDYDLDQLLLGTILFTVLFFLLPTVVVFYLTFASARMLIISLKAALDTCLAFLNHFPLFALMLRVKDSRRLPGGIRFELREEYDKSLNDVPPSPVSYIHLEVSYFSPSYRVWKLPTNKKSVHPTATPRNVRSILPTRPPASETLPLPTCDLLPRHRSFRTPDPPAQPVQHAVQHVAGAAGRDGGGVGYAHAAQEGRE